eukprot:SAG11_NODE_695_length_7694_cov_5.002502_3_plen_72_part_00
MRILVPVGFSLVVLGRIWDPKTQTQLDAGKNGQKNDQGMKKYELEYRSSRLLQGALVPIIYEKYDRICTYA